MEKAVVILGSPRKNGNSAMMAQRAQEGILAAGGTCDVFYLNGMSIRTCQGCDACRRHPERRCILKDDMHLIYDALESASMLVVASPIYMFTVTAQTKLFMDRCYAVPAALEGKRVGILLVYGDEDEIVSGAVNAMQTLRNEYRYAQAPIVGIVHGSADKKGEIAANTKVMDAAYELGKALIG